MPVTWDIVTHDGDGRAEAVQRNGEWECRMKMALFTEATGTREFRAAGFGPTASEAYDGARRNILEKL